MLYLRSLALRAMVTKKVWRERGHGSGLIGKARWRKKI
jgi:hypothetical protein